MPLLQYFVWVGAGLLALLFAVDARLPRPEPRAEPPRNFNIRIAAKPIGPAAITFSGHPVSYGPAPALQVVDIAGRVAETNAEETAGGASMQARAEISPEMSAKPVAKAPSRNRKRYARQKFEQPPRVAEVWDRSPWAVFQ